MPEALLPWARAELAARGIALRAVASTRDHGWSTVLGLQTSHGQVWAKQPAAAFGHEALVVSLLAEHAPGHVLTPLAVDLTAGRLLLPDGGAVLGHGGEGDWRQLCAAVVALQRAAEPLVPQLLAGGVPDRRPGTLAAALVRLLAEVRADDHPWEPGLLAAVSARVADVETWERALTGTRASLDHNDLHPGNVFAGPPLAVFDWGDSVVGHPLMVLADLEVHAPHLVDDVAAAWGADREEAALARRLGRVSRLLTCGLLGPQVRAAIAEPVVHRLARVAHA